MVEVVFSQPAGIESQALGKHCPGQRALELAPHARRAHPTTEHFWPLLVAAGATASPLPATVIEGGIMHGVLAMDAFVFGAVGPLDNDAT